MIDKITIVLEQDGIWRFSAGDVVTSRHDTPYSLLLEVKGYLDKLGYFPPPNTPLSPDPVPFEKTPHRVFVQKRSDDNARKRAEKNLEKLRRDAAAESPQQPPPPPSQG